MKQTVETEEKTEKFSILTTRLIFFSIGLICLAICVGVYMYPDLFDAVFENGGSSKNSRKILFWIYLIYNRVTATLVGLIGLFAFWIGVSVKEEADEAIEAIS